MTFGVRKKYYPKLLNVMVLLTFRINSRLGHLTFGGFFSFWETLLKGSKTRYVKLVWLSLSSCYLMKILWRVVFLTWHDINWWSLNWHFTMLLWISSHIKSQYKCYWTLVSIFCGRWSCWGWIHYFETTVFWHYFRWVATFMELQY